jgi:hypothetical protein
MKVLTLLILTCSCIRLYASEPVSGKPDFEKLIAQLASTHSDESKRAAEALADAGEAALNALRRAETSVNPDLRDKAKAVLLRVVGPAVGGIAASLSLEKKQVKSGESVKFNLTFWNTTDKDVNMYWGWKSPDYGDTDQPADMLVIVNGEGKNRTITGRVYTGPGTERSAKAGPVFKTLAPHSGARVKGTIAFVDSFPLNGQTVNTPGLQLSNNSVLALKDLKNLTTVRLRYFAECNPDDRKAEQGKPEKPDAGYWTGTLASNEVELALENPKP